MERNVFEFLVHSQMAAKTKARQHQVGQSKPRSQELFSHLSHEVQSPKDLSHPLLLSHAVGRELDQNWSSQNMNWPI